MQASKYIEKREKYKDELHKPNPQDLSKKNPNPQERSTKPRIR
jgi:hypothetical protein